MLKFEDVIQTLQDENAALSKTIIRRLSNLDESEREQLMGAWGMIPVTRRQRLMRQISEIAASDFDTDFGAVIRLALTDLDDTVRHLAVEASSNDESPLTFHALMPLATIDRSSNVRSGAISVLGQFILLGELGKFSANLSRQAQNLALRLYRNQNEDVEVRRRALEAISNSSREEVAPLIREAYDSGDSRLQLSAVYAMGRSCDHKWAGAILRELESDAPAMRFEAIRAAGELELETAIPKIAPHLQSGDRQLMEISIWALGEIGGGEARRLLDEMVEYAEDIDDDELLEMVEDALATASLDGGFVD